MTARNSLAVTDADANRDAHVSERSMELAAFNPITYPGWDGLLQTHPQAGFFHTSTWARVLAESYGYRPHYVTLTENGRLVGLVPLMEIDSLLTGRRGSALPFTDACEPLARDAGDFRRLFAAVVARAVQARWRTIELRGGGEFLNGSPTASEFLVHTLMLGDDEEAVTRGFHATTRRNVRKSAGDEITVRRSISREAMVAYYRLHCATRRRHGLPPQPWRFFASIQRRVLATGGGFIMLAASGGRPAAGAVFFHFNGSAIYKFGAYDPRFRHLRPNNRVMWEAIRWCCRNGIRRLSLGRTEPGDQGLLQYKKSWGAASHRLAYYRYDVKRGALTSRPSPVRSSYPVLRILPSGLLRLAGSLLYRHIG